MTPNDAGSGVEGAHGQGQSTGVVTRTTFALTRKEWRGRNGDLLVEEKIAGTSHLDV